MLIKLSRELSALFLILIIYICATEIKIIIVKLKSLIYTKRIRRALGKKVFSNSGNSGKAGLIIDAENLESKWKLTDLYKDLGVNRENFRIVVCGNEIELPETIDADFLKSKEVSITGDFKSERIKDFANDRFDYLICYFTEKNIVGSLLAAETNASVKIGNKPDEFGVYDLEIDSKDVVIFRQEMLKYLKILKRNN